MNSEISPGNVAVHHGSCTTKVAVERRIKIAELVLRVLILGLGVLAAALIAFDSEVRVIFSITKKATFTDLKSLVFLVIANGIVAAYSMVQLVRCVLGVIRGSVLFSKPLAWLIFSGDQIAISASNTGGAWDNAKKYIEAGASVAECTILSIQG